MSRVSAPLLLWLPPEPEPLCRAHTTATGQPATPTAAPPQRPSPSSGGACPSLGSVRPRVRRRTPECLHTVAVTRVAGGTHMRTPPHRHGGPRGRPLSPGPRRSVSVWQAPGRGLRAFHGEGRAPRSPVKAASGGRPHPVTWGERPSVLCGRSCLPAWHTSVFGVCPAGAPGEPRGGSRCRLPVRGDPAAAGAERQPARRRHPHADGDGGSEPAGAAPSPAGRGRSLGPRTAAGRTGRRTGRHPW